MAPNYFLGHTYDPEGHPIVSGVNKLPPPPDFPTRIWADFIGIIVAVTAEPIFVAIVMLAGVEGIFWVVFFNIRFERPVISGPQAWRRRGFTQRNNVEVD